jgi:hypothetical protein
LDYDEERKKMAIMMLANLIHSPDTSMDVAH